MVSNMHTHKMAEASHRRDEKKMKPNIIRDYNEDMLGADAVDQMVSSYDCPRKTTRWYKYIALHIFDIFFFNALHIFDIFLFSAHCLNSKYNLIGDSLKEIPRNKTNNRSDVHYLTALPPNEKKDC